MGLITGLRFDTHMYIGNIKKERAMYPVPTISIAIIWSWQINIMLTNQLGTSVRWLWLLWLLQIGNLTLLTTGMKSYSFIGHDWATASMLGLYLIYAVKCVLYRCR